MNNGVSENKEILNNNNREYILDDDECPLAILMNHPQTRGKLIHNCFEVFILIIGTITFLNFKLRGKINIKKVIIN